MFKFLKPALMILCLAVISNLRAQSKFTIANPSGKIIIDVMVGKSNVQWSVSHKGDVVIDKSPMSITLGDGTVWGRSPRLKKKTKNSVRGKIEPPLYRKTSIQDNYEELILDFKGGYSLAFRAYDDGVAYRFISHLNTEYTVENEEVAFQIPGDPVAYIPFAKGRLNEGKEDPFYSAFQNTYTRTNLSAWNDGRIAFLPLLIEGKNGKKICLTEADLLDYPGMYLKNDASQNALKGVFAPYPKKVVQEGLKGVVKSRESYIAKVTGRTSFPWRVVIVADNDKELLDNDMVYKLATPARFTDFSWIKPGKVAWDWWNNWNIYNVDFVSGVNNDTYKHYIDFASNNDIEYVILDEGWAVKGKNDLFQVVPEIDLKELIDYGGSRNVGIVLWAGYKAFDQDMDKICEHYAAMGVKGFKVDFMDRDDQYMINFNYRAAKAAAKHKLLIDFHGTSKPTGLQRTFPNAINFEGVFGLEELKWAKPEVDQVLYDVTMPFIRMVAGPVDYTQGAMNNANKANFRTVYTEPMSQGTRCRQLAQYVIFESPLNMLCDAPTNYMKEMECTKFITAVPTVWDETIPLEGKISEYIAIARRSGDTWYVGALTNWDARDMELDLSFLGQGEFVAEIFMDGVNAEKVAKDYKRVVTSLSPEKKLNFHLAPGGGLAIKIIKK